jgi:cation:H+ antiporter
MRTVYRYERQRIAEFAEEATQLYGAITLRAALTRFGLASLVVVAAGLRLPFAGDRLAAAMGWHQTFVGTLFLSVATTLPEMVVTVTALRLGALDMAIGNLFGSNLFNIGILAVDDLFYLPGPVLAHVSPLHAVSAASAVMMAGVAVVGLLYRPRTRVLRTVGWASLTLFTLYLLNTYVLYLYAE